MSQLPAQRGRRIAADVVARIWAIGDVGPTEIDRQLRIAFPGRPDLPSIATVNRYLREMRQAPAEAWSLADIPAMPDPAAVLEVIAYTVQATNGRRRTIPRDEAEWVSRVRSAAPSIDTATLAEAARFGAGMGRYDPPRSVLPLAHYLAFTPWRDGGKRWRAVQAAGKVFGLALFDRDRPQEDDFR